MNEKPTQSATALYQAWEASGFSTDLRPSVDRLDDYQPYTLTNIQMITVKENLDRYRADRFNGLNTKATTAVNQHALDGSFLKQFHSYAAAARAVKGLSANIRNVAEGLPIIRQEKDGSTRSYIPQKAYGYLWKKP